MGIDELRKYINIINEGIQESSQTILNETVRTSTEGYCVREKWAEPTKVSPEEKGKYKGWSLAELRKAYNALKSRGPHKKGSPELGRLRELAFAIRAKTGWGKVKENVPEKTYDISEGKVEEKWDAKMKTAKKDIGKWEGYSVADLKKRKKRLMDKESRTAAEQKEVKQINFAIRAKTGWGKISEKDKCPSK